MRAMSVVVSIGGMLITALLLGIVSGGCPAACAGGDPAPHARPGTSLESSSGIAKLLHALQALAPFHDPSSRYADGNLSLLCSADSIGDSMEGMRKGKAEVLESGHTLILGMPLPLATDVLREPGACHRHCAKALGLAKILIGGYHQLKEAAKHRINAATQCLACRMER